MPKKQGQQTIKWDELNRLVLAATDIEAAYRELGCEITGSRPSASGWLSCWALGRPHGNAPSAAINVGDDALRGRYRDLGGDGDSLSLFDVAAKYGTLKTWEAARLEYAKRANLLKKFPQTDQERPVDKLSFVGTWNRLAVRGLIKAYPGVTDESLRLCGAHLARYPAKAPQPRYVVAWPAYGPGGIDGEVRGYVIQAADGGMIDLFKGEGNPTEPVKRVTLCPGSGLIGRHALKHWETAELIWKVEGISDLHALQGIVPEDLRNTHLVITNACGAAETHIITEVAPMFAGKKLAICHDCDVTGQQGAGNWIAGTAQLVESVRNVILPYEIFESHGQDLRDWINGQLADGADPRVIYQQLLDWFAAADEMKRVSPTVGPNGAESESNTPNPESNPVNSESTRHASGKSPNSIAAEFAGLTPEQQCLKRLGIVVLGEIEGSKTIVCFSQNLAKMVEIKAIEKYKLDNLFQDFGEEAVKANVNLGEQPDPAKLGMQFIRQAIAVEGGKRRITDHNQLGIGIWEINGRLIMVNGGEMAILNGHFERSYVPTVEGKLIDFGGGEKWFDFDELQALLEQSKDGEWCKSVFNEVSAIFTRWDNWAADDTPQLITALVCASFLQTIWKWRPQIAICGSTNSGKTILMEETLQHLFGGLSLLLSKPSEAGLRQLVGHTAKVIIVDEFENDKHRASILEWFRLGGRGSSTARGTAGGQKGIKFTLKHMPWVSAVEIGLKRAPDRNRFITLDLKKVKKNKSTLIVPPPTELRALGAKLLVVGLRYWREVMTYAADLKQRGFGRVDRRSVESYSVPCGVIGAVMGMAPDHAADLMQSMFDKRDMETAAESDEAILLQEIYESTITMPHGVRATVSEMLSDEFKEPGWGDALQRAGIKRYKSEMGPECIFFVKSAMRRELLRNSEFLGQDIDQILVRIDGATRCRQRMGGHVTRGVSVPESEIHRMFDDPKTIQEIKTV